VPGSGHRGHHPRPGRHCRRPANLTASHTLTQERTTAPTGQACDLHAPPRADRHWLGAARPHTLAARADLANAYHAAGRLADAATLLRDTLSRSEQELPRAIRSPKSCDTP
jgi:thioredoxin-like negative regulator of GroEL